jgi:hypothetical protein
MIGCHPQPISFKDARYVNLLCGLGKPVLAKKTGAQPV